MSNEVSKGMNATFGVLLALIIVFFVLPMGMCVGCATCVGATQQYGHSETQRLKGAR